jgi:lipopolysaccharide export system protein LptA
MSERQDSSGSRFDVRTLGIAGAIVIAVGVIGVFALMALRAQTPAGGQQRTPPAEVELPTEALANATDAPSVMNAPVESLRGSDEGRIELFDERTGRLSQTLAYSRFEPLESGRYSVTDPNARIILDDGRAIQITSRTARFVRRGSSNEPQSGEFRGDVRIRLLEATGENEVGLTIATDSLRFDSTLGELRTTDKVVANSPESEFRGEGLTVVYSEADRKLLYLRIDRGESLSWTPTERTRDAARSSSSGSQATAAQARADHYRAVFTGPVEIESGSRTVNAERFELWATLFDGGLSPSAITRIRLASTDEQGQSSSTTGDAIVSAGANEPVVMRWSGPLEVQPLDTKPVELANDEVFVRLSSPNQGLVRVDDVDAGLEASGVSFEYGLTSGAFTAVGVGPRGVTVRAKDRAEALVGRFEANLVSGAASFPGPGTMRAIGAALADAPVNASGEAMPQDVSWLGRADFTIAKAPDGALQGALTRAVFTDGVLARDQGHQAGAMLAQLDFDTRDGQSTLRSVSLRDRATLSGEEDGSISAKRIDIAFADAADAGGNPLLRSATAEGDVRASREGDAIRAELVEVDFALGADGRPEVDAFRAELGVEVAIVSAEGERIDAIADTVRASPRNETAELIGEPAVLRRGAATIRGRALRLDGRRGAIEGFGPGEAEYLLAASNDADSLPYERVRATWNSAMSYDDSTGRAEFTGDASLQGDNGALVRDSARAERITALFEKVEGGAADPNDPIPGGDRRLMRAEFLSARYEGTSESNVEIESRRYETLAGAQGGVGLTQLLFLSGERVFVDGPSQGIEVPGPGRLVVEDRRGSSNDRAGGSSKGTTMFEWQGALRASQAAGDAAITNAVLVRHLPLDSTQTVELESERVSAILPERGESASSAGEVVVERVEASGAVYVRSGRRQMIADRLIFAPQESTIEAFPALGNVVTLFDPQVGAPLVARNPVYWNIATDTLRATGLEPISSPR